MYVVASSRSVAAMKVLRSASYDCLLLAIRRQNVASVLHKLVCEMWLPLPAVSCEDLLVQLEFYFCLFLVYFFQRARETFARRHRTSPAVFVVSSNGSLLDGFSLHRFQKSNLNIEHGGVTISFFVVSKTTFLEKITSTRNCRGS